MVLGELHDDVVAANAPSVGEDGSGGAEDRGAMGVNDEDSGSPERQGRGDGDWAAAPSAASGGDGG